MNLRRTSFSMSVALMLAACAGGENNPTVREYPKLPLLTPLQAAQAPIVDLDGTLHVGADTAAPADQLTPSARHGETRVSHGSVQDGVSAAEIIAYLEADAASFLNSDEGDEMEVQLIPDGLLLRFGFRPPTVRVAEGTTPELEYETLRVVQSINAALPQDWQLGFSRDPAPAGTLVPSDFEIVVEFAPQEDWTHVGTPPVAEDLGIAEPRYTIIPPEDPEAPWTIEIVAGRVLVDPTRTGGHERLGVLAHEIIHLLGRGHVDPDRFPRTIMVSGGSEELSEHILHPLDREALLAVYSRLQPGTAPESIAGVLGPWSDTSVHVRGTLGIPGGDIAFGAAVRNGLSQPWAFGPTPYTDLEDNTELSGSITWSGRLTGLTPRAETVAGTASLTVELTTLSGKVDFTVLEHWAANAAPGPIGTGATWHDGDLSYRIEARGNTFGQTGGDAGTVTGAFFGPAHEGMGGVLERNDLSAGFGGKR